MYGIGVQRKGKGKLTVHSDDLSNSPLRLLSRCSSNDGASPSISGTHGPSTPAKSAKTRKRTERDFRTVTKSVPNSTIF
jgi:hypothetical protein